MNKDKIIQLDEFFGNQRQDWTSKIKELAHRLKEQMSGLEEVMSLVVSYRQILVENLASLNNRATAQQSIIDKRYKSLWLEYYQYDYKISDKQREKFIDADLSDERHILTLIQVQIQFVEGSVRTLDNMGFAIKNKIDMTRL